MLEEFRRVVAGLTYREPVLPVVSNLTGEVADAGRLCSPEYWVEQVRRPVRFLDAVRTLEAEGVVATNRYQANVIPPAEAVTRHHLTSRR